jgi:hypothetical protein
MGIGYLAGFGVVVRVLIVVWVVIVCLVVVGVVVGVVLVGVKSGGGQRTAPAAPVHLCAAVVAHCAQRLLLLVFQAKAGGGTPAISLFALPKFAFLLGFQIIDLPVKSVLHPFTWIHCLSCRGC